MSKFSIGERVEKANDDHEDGVVIAVFPPRTATFVTPSIWKATARSSFSPRKNWSSARDSSDIRSGAVCIDGATAEMRPHATRTGEGRLN